MLLYYQHIRTMKWFSGRYVYPLVVVAILASAGLQAAWLHQLFRAEQLQVKRDLEQITGSAAQMSNYLSVAPGHEKGENFRDFFLSAEWLQFKQAYINMRFKQVGSRFNSEIQGDSTIVDLSLRIANGKRHNVGDRIETTRWYDEGENKASVAAADQKDLKRMDSLVRLELKKANLHVDPYYVLNDYLSEELPASRSRLKINKADYRSQQYVYNLHFLNTYQLIVPSVTIAVIYRMQLYLLSSFLMLLLTVVAFYFVFRLLRSQRLYTQARISFTANMTHELKTPVAIMEVALDAITRYNEPDKLEKYINISKSELHRLNQMIEKALNLDQLDNGQIILRPELYDVQQGLEQVVTAMRLHDSNKELQIDYIPSAEPCFVNGDPVHLTNVFYNLTDNALKYGGKPAHISITCCSDSANVTVTVQDNGPGIAKIYQDRIFERFFRIQDETNVHNVKGSGLGLYYVKQMIEKHDGKIRIDSAPGNGSSFIVMLPAYHEI
jgi:signal transduction histidine kinase